MQTQIPWFDQTSGMMNPGVMPQTQIPRLDMVETGKNLIYILEMPGVTPDKLHVEMEGNTLVVSGTAQQIVPSQEERAVYHHRERISTTFLRNIPLTNTVNADQIQAKLSHGLLQIYIPKAQEETPQKHRITVTEE